MIRISQISKYQLYLLQLENYELGRYFRLLFKKGLWPKGGQRKNLVWTMKARVFFAGAIILHIALSVLFFYVLSGGLSVLSVKYFVLSIGLFGLLATCYLLLYILIWFLLWPFDWFFKRLVIVRAKRKIKGLNGKNGGNGNKGELTVIGIAGSYGKTTMKEVLKRVLSSKYQVVSTPESINTPVGIARWILRSVDELSQIIIVEMGEHYRGDVEAICNLARPDIAVVTGINEAHLERMKTLDNIAETIFEIVSKAKPGATVVLNADDNHVMENYQKYVWADHKLAVYGQRNYELGIKNYEFDASKLAWVGQSAEVGEVAIKLLGEYALGDVAAAIKVAKQLGMSETEIKTGIEKIRPVEHRLQPIRSANDILVIDDSYNGNPAGAAEAIKVLSRFSGRRKIYITPGLVETGPASREVHLEIGRQLASAADVVILIRNSVTGWIEEGIKSENRRIGKSDNQIIWFDTALEAHVALKDILKPGDVILFQNDWGDQYI